MQGTQAARNVPSRNGATDPGQSGTFIAPSHMQQQQAQPLSHVVSRDASDASLSGIPGKDYVAVFDQSPTATVSLFN